MADMPSEQAPTMPEDVHLPNLEEARTVLLLTVADDELITGHRHSHWTGVAPSLEEDLAFSTIAQDEVNHADVWYSLIAGQGQRATIDHLALGREPDRYLHAVLCERPPTDFAYTLARHLLYDHFDTIRLRVLAESSDDDIAAVAAKLLHEERYHLEHADHWFRKLANGGDTAREHLRDGLRTALPDALWLFEPLPHEESMVAEGLLPIYTSQLMVRWLETVLPFLEEAGAADALPEAVTGWTDEDWQLGEGFFAERGGRHGVHTEDFTEDVWPEMTQLHRAHPGAEW